MSEIILKNSVTSSNLFEQLDLPCYHNGDLSTMMKNDNCCHSLEISDSHMSEIILKNSVTSCSHYQPATPALNEQLITLQCKHC